MVDLTHAAFRELVAFYGSCDLFITEMVNVRYLKSIPPEKDPYLLIGEKDKPLWIQLVGKDLEDFREAIKKLNSLARFEGYNINFGCVKGKIQRFGWGARLLSDMSQIEKILDAVCETSKKPVSVKIRVPEKKADFHKILELLNSYPLAFVAIHARTPFDGFVKRAKWEWIKKAVELSKAPVIGNGDIFSPEDAAKRAESTGCKGVMIGRAALIRPWIFRDVKSYVTAKTLTTPPSPEEPIELMGQFIKKYLPHNWWEKRLNGFLKWYLQNFTYGAFLLKKSLKLPYEEKIKFLVNEVRELPLRKYPLTPYLN
ncbi:tRNA dihydrouridine synthase [Thermosulfidibacter takaii]|nr:tRNA-dihydrouridine synthase family protein [Thermosulfidibacter takaii]